MVTFSLFTVTVNGVTIYLQDLEGIKYVSKKHKKYSKYSDYFRSLMEVAGQYLNKVDFILKIDAESTILTLNLFDEHDVSKADELRNALLENFPKDIEQISITKGKMNITDTFQKYNN